MLPLAPSLVLAPSFLAMLVCTHAVVSRDRRIWSQLGGAFALVYVPLWSAAYIVELFVVEPRVLAWGGRRDDDPHDRPWRLGVQRH